MARAEQAAPDNYPSESTPPKDVDVVKETGLRNTNTPVVEDGKPVKTPTKASLKAAAEKAAADEAAALAQAEEDAKKAAVEEDKLAKQTEAEAKKEAEELESKANEGNLNSRKVLVTSLNAYPMYQHTSTVLSGGYHIKPKESFQQAVYDDWLKGCIEAGLLKLESVLEG